MTTINMSATSAAWKAIDATTGEFIAPTFTGSIANQDYVPTTAKSVRYANSGTTNYTLVREKQTSFEGMTNPGDKPVSESALTVLKQYGMFPVDTNLGDDVAVFDAVGELMPIRGGSRDNGSRAGVFALDIGRTRAILHPNVGSRIAFCV